MSQPHHPKRVVYLSANASRSHSSLAGRYLGACARNSGFEWETLEWTAGEDDRSVLARLAERPPALVCATFYLFNTEALLSVIRRFKALSPRAVVLGGGPEFLGDNRARLERERGIDGVIRGEGELALPAFLEALDSPAAWARIPGFCGFVNGDYADNGMAETVGNLDRVADLYAQDLAGAGPGDPPKSALTRKPFVLIETSRGCRNRCAFCTSGSSASVRYVSLPKVREILSAIRAAGTRSVWLADRTFNERRTRSVDLLRMMRTAFDDLGFHLEIDPCRVGPALLGELAAARPGQFHLDVGVQSLDPSVLRAIGRRGPPESALRGLAALCRLPGVTVHADLLAGLPGQTLAGVFDDLAKVIAVAPAEIQLEVLKLLPGTRLNAERERRHLSASPDPPYDVLRTDAMDYADLHLAHWLGRAVDWFYGLPCLKPVVARATADAPDFWRRMVAHCRERARFETTPTIENRFRLLRDAVGESATERIRELAFAWMKEGLSPHAGFCDASPWPQPLPEVAVLLEGDAAAKGGRQYRLDLDRPYVFRYGRKDVARQAVAVFALPEDERVGRQ